MHYLFGVLVNLVFEGKQTASATNGVQNMIGILYFAGIINPMCFVMQPSGLFDDIKALLQEHLNDDLRQHNDRRYLSISDSDIWFTADAFEFTVGFDFMHKHYDLRYDDWNEVVEHLCNLITKRKRITNYYKGGYLYKMMVEIELDSLRYQRLGTAVQILYPFWRRTRLETIFVDKLIDSAEFEKGMQSIMHPSLQTVGNDDTLMLNQG